MTMLIAGYTPNKAPQKSIATKAILESAAQKVVPLNEVNGETDPIANPLAPKGGTYTAWGGFPKSLNVWLDNNSFSRSHGISF